MQFEVLIDKQENPRKCTLTPLIKRKDFQVRYFQRGRPIAPLQAQVLLHINGEDFPKLKSPIQSIAVIDCVWKHVDKIFAKIAKPYPLLVKIPVGFKTAYPRKNKQGQDPDGGLATNEALFIAAAFCGNWDISLLDGYYFAEEFLKINKENWKKYELHSS